MELESLSKLRLDPGNGGLVLGSNGHIINKDRDDDASVILAPYPNAVVRLNASEAHLLEHLVQLQVPHPARLLQAIDGLQQLAHPLRSTLETTLRLLHVNLSIKITIVVGRGYVNALLLKVLQCSNG